MACKITCEQVGGGMEPYWHHALHAQLLHDLKFSTHDNMKLWVDFEFGSSLFHACSEMAKISPLAALQTLEFVAFHNCPKVSNTFALEQLSDLVDGTFAPVSHHSIGIEPKAAFYFNAVEPVNLQDGSGFLDLNSTAKPSQQIRKKSEKCIQTCGHKVKFCPLDSLMKTCDFKSTIIIISNC